MSTSYGFGPFVLDPDRRVLTEAGIPVQIGSRAFDLLLTLVQHRGRVLTKRELLDRIWPGSAVEENNLSVNVSVLRKALREQALDQRFIQTVSGRGYRFVAPVHASPPPGRTGARQFPPPAEVPAIAVLPFAPIEDDLAPRMLGEGMAQEIIAGLSRNRWLTVIARTSLFGLDSAAGEVARALDVRYVLQGSIQAWGSRVRVTAQLIDTATHAHLVAERYDIELGDIFTAQDELVERIVAAVRPAVAEAEQDRSLRRHPDSLDAWAAYQRGIWHFSRFAQPEGAEARIWFQRAIELDPHFAPGYYGLALLSLYDGSAWLPGAEPDWQQRGESLANQAVLLDERDSGAHSVLGLARMVRGDHPGALDATARALALNPNDATALATRGATLVFSGRLPEGLHTLGQALRRNPRDPRMRIRYAHIGLGHYFGRDYEQAEATAREIIWRWPGYNFGPRLLAIVLGETGRIEEGRAALAEAVQLHAAPFDDFRHARMPWYRQQDHARVVRALRALGWTGIA